MKPERNLFEHSGMRNIDRLMFKYFGKNIELVNYWGPVQMCVFCLEYRYLPLDYTIRIECERGVVVLGIKNREGKSFCPTYLHPPIRCRYEDVEADMDELVRFAYEVIRDNQVDFEM